MPDRNSLAFDLTDLLDQAVTIDPGTPVIRTGTSPPGPYTVMWDLTLPSGQSIRLIPIWAVANPTGTSSLDQDRQAAALALAAGLPVYRWRSRSTDPSSSPFPLDVWIDLAALPAAHRLFDLIERFGFDRMLALALARGEHKRSRSHG